MLRRLTIVLCLVATGCASAPGDVNETKLTVGLVQKEIRVGMTGGEVAGVLGSPNIVTSGEDRNENWIYDKVATQVVEHDIRLGILGLSFGADVSGGAHSSASRSSRVSTQRTLTIIIKFGSDGLVRDFAYHATKF